MFHIGVSSIWVWVWLIVVGVGVGVVVGFVVGVFRRLFGVGVSVWFFVGFVFVRWLFGCLVVWFDICLFG